MRAVLLAVLVSACGGPSSQPGSCESDADCNGETCARDGGCYPASQIRSVVITWTVSGAPPTTTSCASIPDLTLEFDSDDLVDAFEFEPVPCIEGKFTLDKLPMSYTEVELGVQGNFALSQGEAISSDNTASFDLTP